MPKISNHGDIILKPVKNKKPLKSANKSNTHVIEQSTTTGNRHEVHSETEPIFRWISYGVEYIRCDKPYIIRHVGGDEEHGVQEVEAGTRMVLHEMEHDPWKNELRRVID